MSSSSREERIPRRPQLGSSRRSRAGRSSRPSSQLWPARGFGPRPGNLRGALPRLGIELEVERPELGGGNLQAEARRVRYAAAERLRLARGLDWIATGHTRTDLAETVLYRLATSPGRRALLGLRRGAGDVVRPLLAAGSRPRRAGWPSRRVFPSPMTPATPSPSSRATGFATRCYRSCARSARRRRRRSPRPTRSSPRRPRRSTALPPRLWRRPAPRPPGRSAATPWPELDPAIRRLVLRRLAERAAGDAGPAEPRAGGRDLAARPRARGRGGRAGRRGGGPRRAWPRPLHRRAGAPRPAEGILTVPGVCRFGDWEVRAELERGVPPADGPDLAVLDPAALGAIRHGAGLARGRPDAAARPRRDQVAAGPVHRPEGAAVAAPRPARGRGATSGSPGSRGSPSPRSSRRSPARRSRAVLRASRPGP